MEEGGETPTEIDLVAALGASHSSGTKFSIYLPDADRAGRRIDVERWIRRGSALLLDISGGVTRLPEMEGGWTGATVVQEKTTIIYSILKRPDEFRRRIGEIRGFLHAFGRETSQGEVLVELQGEAGGRYYHRAYSITDFDPVMSVG